MSLLLKKLNKGQLEFLQKDEPKCEQPTVEIEVPYLYASIPQQLTLPEVSRILCISVGTARNIISKGGDFPSNYRAGRKRLFCPVELKKWLRKKQLES
tara:strand:+ start:93 stop:386 length:294 start_codon:yes stop_codon:yes gene_type:complete